MSALNWPLVLWVVPPSRWSSRWPSLFTSQPHTSPAGQAGRCRAPLPQSAFLLCLCPCWSSLPWLLTFPHPEPYSDAPLTTGALLPPFLSLSPRLLSFRRARYSPSTLELLHSVASMAKDPQREAPVTSQVSVRGWETQTWPCLTLCPHLPNPPALRLAHTGHHAGPKLTQRALPQGLALPPSWIAAGLGPSFSDHPPRGASPPKGFSSHPVPFGRHSFGPLACLCPCTQTTALMAGAPLLQPRHLCL